METLRQNRALIFLGCLLYAAGIGWGERLIPEWGRWYAPSPYQRTQSAALLRGSLALADHPAELAHDLAWSRGGVQQVWGLGVPAWRALWDAGARLFGRPFFPDRIAFLGALALTAWLVTRAFFQEERVGALPIAWGSGVVLLLFPPFLRLLSTRFDVYEEVVAYGYLAGVCLYALGLRVSRRPTLGRWMLLSGAAGLTGFIRPTVLAYGLATVMTVGWGLRRSGWSWPKLGAGGGAMLVGIGLLLGSNSYRFGHPLEFGHQLNFQGVGLSGSMYATRFGHPYAQEPLLSAGKELAGGLFLTRRLNGQDYYASGVMTGQSTTTRWREFYFTPFTPVTGVMLAGLGVLVVTVRRATRSPVAGAFAGYLAIAWAGLAVVALGVFYLRSPVWSSRYAMDFAPALAVALAAGWRWLAARHLAWAAVVFAGWAAGEFAAGSVMGYGPITATLAELSGGNAPPKAVKEFIAPGASYLVGANMKEQGFDENGSGWDPGNGVLQPCAAFLVLDPEFVELTLQAKAGATLTDGERRSILLPVTGPAVAQLPAMSQTCRVPVDALGVSLPAATLVVSWKAASPALARPEPVSLAVQEIDTFNGCHAESAKPHDINGALLSTPTE